MQPDVPALSMRSLCKNFDGKPAVTQLELTIQPGEFYALLGPNGAGKTTTIRMAAGLLLPDSGSIEIFGVDVVREPVASKRMTAWLPDEPALYDKLRRRQWCAQCTQTHWLVCAPIAARRCISPPYEYFRKRPSPAPSCCRFF